MLALRSSSPVLGARSFVRGVGWVFRHPKQWPRALVPALLALVIVTACIALGVFAAVRLSATLRADDSAFWQFVGLAGTFILGLAAVPVAALVGLALAQPASGWALDELSRAQDRSLGGPVHPDDRWYVTMWRSLRVTLAGLLLSLPLFAVLLAVDVAFPPALVVTVPLKFLLGALVVAWDLLDYPLGLRAMPVRARLAFIGRNFGAVLVFGACASLVLFIPGVGLLVLLPFGVAGATQLVAEVERGPLPKPPR